MATLLPLSFVLARDISGVRGKVGIRGESVKVANGRGLPGRTVTLLLSKDAGRSGPMLRGNVRKSAAICAALCVSPEGAWGEKAGISDTCPGSVLHGPMQSPT